MIPGLMDGMPMGYSIPGMESSQPLGLQPQEMGGTGLSSAQLSGGFYNGGNFTDSTVTATNTAPPPPPPPPTSAVVGMGQEAQGQGGYAGSTGAGNTVQTGITSTGGMPGDLGYGTSGMSMGTYAAMSMYTSGMNFGENSQVSSLSNASSNTQQSHLQQAINVSSNGTGVSLSVQPNFGRPENIGGIPQTSLVPPPPPPPQPSSSSLSTGTEQQEENEGIIYPINTHSEELFSLDNNIYHGYYTGMPGYPAGQTLGMQQPQENMGVQNGLPIMGFPNMQEPRGSPKSRAGGIHPFGYIKLPSPIESHDFIKFSTSTVVNASIHNSYIPLCAMVQALNTQSTKRSPEESGTAGIVHRVPRIRTEPIRCPKCQAYINCYSVACKESQESKGHIWRCSICGSLNPIPKILQDEAAQLTEKCVSDNLDESEKTKMIYSQFPQLIHNTYECVLTRGYVTRNPLPPLITFVVDINNLKGHEEIVAELMAVRKCVEELIEFSKPIKTEYAKDMKKAVKAALVLYDTNVHLISFSGTDDGEVGTKSKEYVLQHKTDGFPPVPVSKFVANLTTQGTGFLAAIDRLLNKYSADEKKCNTILGTDSKEYEAVEAALKIIKATPDTLKRPEEAVNVCGRIIHFNHHLQLQGKGAIQIKTREKVTDDTILEDMHCYNKNWKQLALNAFEASVVIDTYVMSTMPNPFRGLAELAVTSEFTGGKFEYYPSFNRLRDQSVVMNDLVESILSKDYIYNCGTPYPTEEIDSKSIEDEVEITKDMKKHLVPSYAQDCAIRMRASTIAGNKINFVDYYGACEYSSTKLIIIGGMDRHSTIMLDLSADITTVAYIQMCLLYTDMYGNRLMRVTTVPITAGDAKAHYNSFDANVTAAYYAKDITRRLINNRNSNGIPKSRGCSLVGPQKISGKLVELTAKIIASAVKINGTVPNNISMFGVYMMSLAKSKMMSAQNIDEAVYMITLIRRSDVESVISLLYPKMYSIADNSQERLLLRKLDQTKVYILQDLYCIYVFSGAQTDDSVELNYYADNSEFPVLKQDAQAANELIARVRRCRGKSLPVFCVPKRSRLQNYIRTLMIEDVGDLTNEEWNKRLNSVVTNV